MDKNKAIAYFEKVIRDADQVLPHCSEALRAELLEQRGYYELALEALRPAPSDEPLTREQLMQVRPERPILVRVRCLDQETGEPDPEDEEFEIWDGQCFANADTYDTLEHYGKKFLAYAYTPACVGVELTGTQEAWISVDDHLPPEHDSIFKKLIDPDKWAPGMFSSISDDVIVSVRFSDGTKKTGSTHTKDGHWVGLPAVGAPVVTHWMPFPGPAHEPEKPANGRED